MSRPNLFGPFWNEFRTVSPIAAPQLIKGRLRPHDRMNWIILAMIGAWLANIASGALFMWFSISIIVGRFDHG